MTILRSFEEGMRQTQQTPRWHAEGDVYAHTMMVVEALPSLRRNVANDTSVYNIGSTCVSLPKIMKIFRKLKIKWQVLFCGAITGLRDSYDVWKKVVSILCIPSSVVSLVNKYV